MGKKSITAVSLSTLIDKLLSARLIPYLNHTCGPAFAVHPRTSAIFSQQEDKSEPAARRSQTSCPSFRLYLYRIDYLQVHRPFRKKQLFFKFTITNYNYQYKLPFSYCTSFFRYTRISPVQGTIHWVASPRHIGGQADTPQGSFHTKADLSMAVYYCIRKGCTFCCERFCDMGLLLAVSAFPPDIAVKRQIFPVGILTGSS